jgi:hypothetical protein
VDKLSWKYRNIVPLNKIIAKYNEKIIQELSSDIVLLEKAIIDREIEQEKNQLEITPEEELHDELFL